MKKPVVWLFSGQGSQYFQMGRELYEHDAVFRTALLEADEILRPRLNHSLVEEIYRPRADRFEAFRRILHSHPAILIVEHALMRSLHAQGLRPDRIVGHSLGELSAFVAAGSLTFEAALTAVAKQAMFLEYCAPPGAMLVVLAEAQLVQREPALFAGCEVAGVHFPRSFVLAGSAAAIRDVRTALKARQIDTHELPVAHPFHSAAMDAVKAPVLGTLAAVTFAPAQVPVYSVALDAEVAVPSAEHFWEATRRSTDFPRAVRRLETTGPNVYVDLGPSGSMTTAVKYNLAQGAASELFPIMTPFGHERRNIERLRARVNAG